MKTAIISLPLHSNYGGILQSYALQTVLRRMGHEPVSLDIDPYIVHCLPWWKAIYKYPSRAIKKLWRPRTVIMRERKYNMDDKVIQKYTRQFVDRYIHRVLLQDAGTLRNDGYGAIVVGSDQVWRPRYFKGDIRDAFLRFAKDWDVKRIAYAASFGTDEWEFTPEQTSDCAELLGRFDAVSVREDSGVGLCRKYLHAEAQHVLDPTMLLSAGDYTELIENGGGTMDCQGGLMCYILDESPEKASFVDRLAKEKSLVPFAANGRAENRAAPLETRVQPPVEQWLRSFRDAEYVVTDSFHACIFSILFRKPFVAIGNPKRGMSRFRSLLGMFGLADRLVLSPEDSFSDADIDYDKVYRRLETLRGKSLAFLENNLKHPGV